MRGKKKNALFGRYPSCDMLNNALRFMRDGQTKSACEEIIFAIDKADGYFHEDIIPFVRDVRGWWAYRMDDLISRQAAMKEFSDFVRESNNSDFAPTPTWNDAVSLVESMPSAERHGRWEDIEHAPNDLLYVTCSVCGKRQTVEATNYCGNCGADMREKKNECDDCFVPMFYNLEDDDSICRDCGVRE